MPSLISATLFFALGLCSARCTSSGTSLKPSATSGSGAQRLATLCSAVSPVLSSPLKATSSIPAGKGSNYIATSPAEPTSITTQNIASGNNIIDGFKPGAKWQIVIQDPVDPRGGLQPADASVVDVDLFLASKDSTLIPRLHTAGATVLCYFNAGAIQYTDCDWPEWNTHGLFNGKTVANYDQERYVDVTSETVVGLHQARIDLAHSIGCDGVDPDNVDTYELDPNEAIGKQITQEDMISFLETLASYAHSKTTTLGHPLMIGQKNAVEITDRIHSFMDFAVSENCVGSQNVGSNRGNTDEFCSTFHEYYVANGKPVFDIEYPASLASGGSAKLRRDASDIAVAEAGCSAGASDSDIESFCVAGNSTGISRILKLDKDEFGLNGCTQYCSEGVSFVLPTYESNSTNSCYFGP